MDIAIIERAKKLHRLTVSSNRAEAEAAAGKLSDLVRVHGLRLSDLDIADHPQIVYRDRVVVREVPVYRGRIVHSRETAPPPAHNPEPPTPQQTGHYKVDDDGYCMQKCSCGEWFMDEEFRRHMATTFYARRRGD